MMDYRDRLFAESLDREKLEAMSKEANRRDGLIQANPVDKSPDTKVLSASYHLIPLESIRAMARVFREGILEYKARAVNARNLEPAVFSKEWQDERFSHAVDHLFKGFEGDTTEDHFAKVMWYCSIIREVRRREAQEVAEKERLLKEHAAQERINAGIMGQNLASSSRPGLENEKGFKR